MGIMFGIAVVSGFLFPALLIDAIKEPDNTKNKLKACISFGIIVLCILVYTVYS